MTTWIVSQTRILSVYKAGQLVNQVKFVRSRNGPNQLFRDWTATHWDRDKYLPFSLHFLLREMKQCLIDEGYTWEWSAVKNDLEEY